MCESLSIYGNVVLLRFLVFIEKVSLKVVRPPHARQSLLIRVNVDHVRVHLKRTDP